MNEKLMTAAANVTSYGVVNLYNRGLFRHQSAKNKSGNPYAKRPNRLYITSKKPKVNH